MSESKFLKYQDKNGNNVPDVCPDLPFVEQPPKCPDCVPDPNYVPPDWKTQTTQEPWFDKKRCKYYVTVVTDETSIVPGSSDKDLNYKPTDTEERYIEALYEYYQDEAVTSLLENFEKIDTDDSRAEVQDSIKAKKYYLNTSKTSRLKLLYCIHYDDFAHLESIGEESTEDEEDEDASESLTSVTYNANKLYSRIRVVQKTMWLFSRYYRVASYINKSSIVFSESGKLYSISQMDRYGSGIVDEDYLMSILKNLDRFLNSKGYNIFTGFTVNDYFSFKKMVDQITFTFNEKNKLIKIEAYVQGCGDTPVVYKKKALRQLNQYPVFKDPTAMGYFIKLKEMGDDIKARQAPTWNDFITKYTFPAAEELHEWPKSEGTTAGCIADALAQEAKQLGQDILDGVFSIGDAVTYRYVKNMCVATNQDKLELDAKLGLVYDPDKRDDVAIDAFAIEQAYKELQEDGHPFVSICAKLDLGNVFEMGDRKLLDQIWSQAFGSLKWCGVNKVQADAIKCLAGSLSFEQFLSANIKSAIKHMSLENFGSMLAFIPTEKQQEIENKIISDIQNADISSLGINVDQLSYVIDNGVPQPWTDPNIVLAERGAEQDEGDNTTTSETDPLRQPQERRTLATQFDLAGQADTIFDKNTLMGLYATALTDVMQDSLLDVVVPLLDRMPGVPMLASVLIDPECPRPAVLDPNALSFINSSLEYDPCSNNKDPFTLPRISDTFNWNAYIPWKDWGRVALDAGEFAAQQALVVIIQNLTQKLCKIIGDAACKLIETGAAIGVAAVETMATGERNNFAEIVSQAICGEDISTTEIQEVLSDLFSKLGAGAAALNNDQTVSDFFADQSGGMTRREMLEAFDGNMSDTAATLVDNLIEYEYPIFREGMPNKESIKDFYKNVGNLFPADVRQNIKDFLNKLPDDDKLPANPTLCATPDDLEDYCNLRVALLEGRATENQAKQMCDNDNEGKLQDLEDLLDALPLERPTEISDPGCDNGFFPFENESTQLASKSAMATGLDHLKINFVEDMLGNGPWWGDWGLLNMILSDTMGRALTTHHRLVGTDPRKVDFITDKSLPDDYSGLAVASNPALLLLGPVAFLLSDPSPTKTQFHNYPTTVAEWLRDYMDNKMNINFSSTNDKETLSETSSSYINLGWSGGLGTAVFDNPNLIGLPDFGYNVEYYTKYVNSQPWLVISRQARKATPDITLEFRDNLNGLGSGNPLPEVEGYYGVGYDFELYLADVHYNESTETYCNVGGSVNPLDTARMRIVEYTNESFYYPILGTAASPVEALALALNDESVIEDQVFEFLTVEDTLGYVSKNIVNYPSFAKCFEEESTHSPQIVLLQEMLSENNSSTSKDVLKEMHDEAMNTIFSTLRTAITSNEVNWSFGAQFDSLSPEDAEYVVDDGQTDSPGGTLYSKATLNGKKLRNRDAILGISRDQYNNKDTPEKTRVFYLSPTEYGGNFTSPAVYVKPLQNQGWYGFAEVMFPEPSPCKPSREDLVNFGDIAQRTSTWYNTMPADKRLSAPKDCVLELPYNRILDRTSRSGIYGLIDATCRIYAVTHFIKAANVFREFNPSFPHMYGTLFAQFVVEDMEKSLKDAQSGFFEFFNPFKDEEFWYGFLEQSVQYYSYLIDTKKLPRPPASVIEALVRLNNLQSGYAYPTRELVWDLKKSRQIPLFQTLTGYREEKNYEAIQATEEDAKLVLKELMIMQLNEMGKRFVKNLEVQDLTPSYYNMGYYVLSDLTQGGIDLDLHKKIKKEYTDLPTSGSALYTAGDEFSLPSTGELYTGYYHVHGDDNGEPIYMVGEYHTEDAHEELLPLGNKVVVPIGDIAEYGSSSSTLSSRPFVVQKYISINGNKKAPTTAIETIKQNPGDLNISDVYPGTMEPVMVTDEETGEERQVGITGQLGVRYGLQFSILVQGVVQEYCTVEIDALDLKIGEIQPLEANSDLLFCLINHLVEDPRFKVAYEYIFPVTKALSTLAIYTDMSFLPSIGETTVGMGVGKPGFLPTVNRVMETDTEDDPWAGASPASFAGVELFSDSQQIPGAKVKFPNADDGDYTPDYSASSEGWANYFDRKDSPLLGLLTVTWDEWDKVLLKNSKATIKSLFKSYYFLKDYDPTRESDRADPGARVIKNLKSAMFPSPGKALFPWWKRRKIRSNPFDANGNKCKK